MVNIIKIAQLNNVNISDFTTIHNVNIMVISYLQGGKTPIMGRMKKMKKTAYFRFMTTAPADLINMCADAIAMATCGRWNWQDAYRLERDVQAFLERDSERPAGDLETVIVYRAMHYAQQQRRAAAVH